MTTGCPITNAKLAVLVSPQKLMYAGQGIEPEGCL